MGSNVISVLYKNGLTQQITCANAGEAQSIVLQIIEMLGQSMALHHDREHRHCDADHRGRNCLRVCRLCHDGRATGAIAAAAPEAAASRATGGANTGRKPMPDVYSVSVIDQRPA
jgi:hypothetical protein